MLFQKFCISLQRLSKLKDLGDKITTKNSKIQMASKIIVDWGLRQEIMTVYKTTYPTVRDALNGSDSTKLRRGIRAYALAHGGVEVPAVRYEKTDERTWVRRMMSSQTWLIHSTSGAG